MNPGEQCGAGLDRFAAISDKLFVLGLSSMAFVTRQGKRWKWAEARSRE
jgi:hypothetical protein